MGVQGGHLHVRTAVFATVAEQADTEYVSSYPSGVCDVGVLMNTTKNIDFIPKDGHRPAQRRLSPPS